MTFHTSGHIRSTNETNFQGRIRALVFGEDDRVINPGDMILEMEHSNPGDRLGNNAERFEIYIAGREIANGFSELNDPEDQAERFRQQVKDKDAGDLEAMHFDADYIRALEHGMPPTK